MSSAPLSFHLVSSEAREKQCEVIKHAMRGFDICEETSEGSRVLTHCVYPSFHNVSVYIAKIGNNFKVHDGNGAYDAAWLHGRDDALIAKHLRNECRAFHLELVNNSIVATVSSQEWLPSAIIGVANASALAARRAVEHLVATSEAVLSDKIETVLVDSFGKSRLEKNVEIMGSSGGRRRFDFALKNRDENSILINGVSPHHGSISAKYVSFADTEISKEFKFAVFDRPLETNDAALMGQVASVLPITALVVGARRALREQ